MQNFTPLSALAGGLLIGLSAVLLMLFLGRVAGVSGIIAHFLGPDRRDSGWRLAFLAGLIAGPLVVALVQGQLPTVSVAASPLAIVAAGLLVGFGTRFSGGCTSGHGVCGLARLSTRSLVATLVFMGTAAVVVFVQRHVMGV